eukprot:CAMPEP_0113695798 /NCGR_PEP_ID=MMETSP0038_2-20120614/21111_1 /TAXON_ID=2898 /ORGANISM="Cryptomonas paramecium" /LENGTH=183 /DNA_ID=CAMNT_0000618403 /DNA_START=257 /DNA_END=808 /DNA_ORIENTATION=+ /assembly_acc=CAM_ASM_000170
MQNFTSPLSKVDAGNGMKFVIFDAPNDSNVKAYIKELLDSGVKHVVRVCEPTYNLKALEEAGISTHDWPYPDGDPPPDQVIDNWLSLIHSNFSGDSGKSKLIRAFSKSSAKPAVEGGLIGIHCVAGLGRAPVLVAIALIEAGMDPLDAVHLIRSCRRGAINSKQLSFLESYKRRAKKDGCSVM